MLKVKPTSATDSMLAVQLFELLNQHGIVYCHWKSNELLAAGLRGDTDLDLLVDRASFAPTIALLLNLGFKQAEVRWGPRTPGVLHFFAFDPQATNLIHVHLYDHLLTGESLVKTHVLPCDSVLLAGSDRVGNVKVPTKEAEAALCVLRSFIKHGSVLHTILHGSGRTEDEPAEFWFAEEGVTASAAYEALHKHYGAIDEDLFTECFEAAANNHSTYRKWRLGLKVRRCLRGCARHTYLGRLKAYSSLISTKIRRIVKGKIKNKVLSSGGAVVAFIGGDATGKSTLVAETKNWLGQTFAVRVAHIGKPGSTWLTAPLHALLPLARRLMPHQRHQARQARKAATNGSVGQPKSGTGRQTSLVYAIRAITLAWDRARLLRKVKRYAAAGEIVICDRYPADAAGGTDGPRLHVDSQQTWLINRLARYERRLYAENAPPDMALRLHVPIETAKQRNERRQKLAKHTDRDLEIRHQQVRNWSKTGTTVVRDIDTNASLEQTILSVKETIWESL